MKKLLVLILVLGLSITTFAGCATSTTPAPSETETETTAVQIYTITYNRNYSGAPAATTAQITAGQPIHATIQHWGYTFFNWYLEPACTTVVKADTKASKDIALYAGWKKWDDTTLAYMTSYKDEMDLAKFIANRPTAFTPETFDPYYEAYLALYLEVEAGQKVVDEAINAKVQALKALRYQLARLADPGSVSLYIWGNSGKNMAVEAGMAEQEYLGAFDTIGFKPFLVAYKAASQETVKGNIIIVAGGNYKLRNNYTEAYTTAKEFQARGYNAFVLQRRVAPSAAIDSSLDLQRSIRYLRYNAATLGISKPETIIACGFSDGGFTIMDTVNQFYGGISPTTVYADYVPDDVDKVSADLSAMILIYGVQAAPGETTLDLTSPKLPPAFIVSGTDGAAAIQLGSVALFSYLQAQGIHAELHMFSQTPDSFGLGKGLANQYMSGWSGVDQWSSLADTFLQTEFKLAERGYFP